MRIVGSVEIDQRSERSAREPRAGGRAPADTTLSERDSICGIGCCPGVGAEQGRASPHNVSKGALIMSVASCAPQVRYGAMRMAKLRASPGRALAGAKAVIPPRLSPREVARAAGRAAERTRSGAVRVRRAIAARYQTLDWSELGARISSAKFSVNPRRLERSAQGQFALRAKVPLCEPVLFPALAMPTAALAALCQIAQSAVQAHGGTLVVPAETTRLVRAALMAEKGARLLRDAPEAGLAWLKTRFPEAQLRDLARFIIACNGDHNKAASRWQKHTAWRGDELTQIVHGTNPTLDYSALDGAASPEVISELAAGTMVVRGHDRQGRPLMIWDTASARDSVPSTPGRVLRMVVYLMEAMTAEMGPEVHSTTMLIHAERGKFDLSLIKGAGQLFAEQYPERLGQVLVFPVGPVSRWLWSLAAPFLPKRTQGKVVLLESANWRDEIRKYVAEDQLPARFGGKDQWDHRTAWAAARAASDVEDPAGTGAPGGEYCDKC